MSLRRAIILLLLVLIIGVAGPILVSVLIESGRPIEAPTVTPRPATITPEGGAWDCSRRMACGDFSDRDLMRGYALACPDGAEALDGDGDGIMCEPAR